MGVCQSLLFCPGALFMSAYMTNNDRMRQLAEDYSPRMVSTRRTVRTIPTVVEMEVLRRHEEDAGYSKGPLLYEITQ